MSIFDKKYNLASLKSLNEKQKLKLIGIFICFLVTLWFFLIHSKIKQQIAYNTNLLQQINEKNAQIEQSENKCIKLTKKIENLRSDINNSNPKDIKKEIICYAKESGLSLKSYVLLATDSNINTNAKIQSTTQNTTQDTTQNITQGCKQACKTLLFETVSYEFSGKMDQIIAFCNKLNLSKSCFECQEIHIIKQNTQENVTLGNSGNNGTVKIVPALQTQDTPECNITCKLKLLKKC